MKEDPQGTNHIVGGALKLADDDVSGMLSGLKLTAFATTRRSSAWSAPSRTSTRCFGSAFVIWRKKGVVTKVVEARDWKTALRRCARRSVQEPEGRRDLRVQGQAEGERPRHREQEPVDSLHTGSDEIMPGSYFTLDSLGETMLAFGNHVPRHRGQHRLARPGDGEQDAEREARRVGEGYLVKNFSIPPERFITVGKGSANPVADNATEDGRALNRRTDIKVVLNAQ